MRDSFVCTVLVVVILAAGCSPAPDDSREVPTPSPEPGLIGTVKTIAGPGFCARTSVRDRASQEVGALALDQEGRIFFDAGSANNGFVARVDPDGRLSKINHLTARGPFQQNPDRQAAPSAGRLAADGSGGVFIAAGSKIVQLDRRGALHNIAGDPKHPPAAKGAGSTGDGGPAVDSRFSSARSIVADEAGNLYVADSLDGPQPGLFIRFINRSAAPVTFYEGTPLAVAVQSGQIATIAGGAENGEGLKRALSGRFHAFAVSGPRLYVATSSGGSGASGNKPTLRLVNLSGSPVAAHGTTIGSGSIETLLPPGARRKNQEVPALGGPIAALAADSGGNVFVSDGGEHRVLKIDGGGLATILAGASKGDGRAGFNGNDRRAAGAMLNDPFSLAVGTDKRVYISDRRNGQIRFVDQTGVIRVTPGAGLGLTWTCQNSDNADPKESGAGLRQGGPANVASDGEGNTYFTNALGHQVKKVQPSGKVTNVAGDGRAGDCSAKSPARSMPIEKGRLRNPGALALAFGGIYVADCGNARISFLNLNSNRVNISGQEVAPKSMMTVAGSGKPGFEGDGQRASRALLGGSTASPLPGGFRPALEDAEALPPEAPLGALAADGKGNLFLADTGNGRVRRINRAGVIATLAGEGMAGPLGDCCKRPIGLAADKSGNLYVLDVATLRVWFINRGRLPLAVRGVQVAAGSAAPVAGDGGVGFAGEGGRATESQLLFPMGIALDRKNNLYIVEVGATLGRTLFDPIHRGVDVRKVDAGGAITTIVGPGFVGFNGDGLKSNLTSLSFPTGIAVDRCGNLLIADLGNDRLRRVNLRGSCVER